MAKRERWSSSLYAVKVREEGTYMTVRIDSGITGIAAIEMAVLASLRVTYGRQDLQPDKDKEPNILGRVKVMLRKYIEQRLAGRFNIELLVKIQQQLCMYRVLVPEFYRGPLLSFQDLQRAVAALREPRKPVRK